MNRLLFSLCKFTCHKQGLLALLIFFFSYSTAFAHDVTFPTVRQGLSSTGTVSADTLIVGLETTFEISINPSALTSASISSFDMTISYDSSLVLAKSVSFVGSAGAGMAVVTNVDTPGRIVLAAAGAYPFSGNGHLVNITFESLGLEGTSAIQFDRLTFNEGEPVSSRVSGSVQIASVSIGDASPNKDASIRTADLQETPTTFSLDQNYPNPFNPSTTIQFALPQETQVNLIVYDMLGREVAHLAEGVHKAGIHSITFEALHMASGTYIYQLEAGDYTETRNMLLIK